MPLLRYLQGCNGQMLAVPQFSVTCSLVNKGPPPSMGTSTDYLKLLLFFLMLNDLSATLHPCLPFSESLAKVSPLLGEFSLIPHDCLEWLGYVWEETIKK